MNFTACLAVVACCLTQSLAATRSLAASVSAPTVIKDISYVGAGGDARRSFDLYLPAKSNVRPPLLIFVHGGFWLLTDDEYRIGPSLAENLVKMEWPWRWYAIGWRRRIVTRHRRKILPLL